MAKLGGNIFLIGSLSMVLALGPARDAAAWDYPGHRIVGAIADLVLQQYHPGAYAKVSGLLEKRLADGAVLKRTLSQAAVFADCAKPNDEPFCGRPPSDEEKNYATRNHHHDRFHFTDVPLEQSQYRDGAAGTYDFDVVHIINYAVKQLHAKSGDDKPKPIEERLELTDAEAVWLLAHLVGDIHQPLHVGAKYFKTPACDESVDPNTMGDATNHFGIGTTVAETAGGNLIALTATEPSVPPAKNLHFYWDGAVVVRAMRTAGLGHSELEYAKLLAEKAPDKLQVSGPPETWAAQWASEIMPLAVEAHRRLVIRKAAKPSPFPGSGGCTWTTTLDPAYEEWASQQAQEQLAKAGFRLAALLAEIFK